MGFTCRYHDTIERYCDETDTWEIVGEMPTSRSWLSCVSLQLRKDIHMSSSPGTPNDNWVGHYSQDTVEESFLVSICAPPPLRTMPYRALSCGDRWAERSDAWIWQCAVWAVTGGKKDFFFCLFFQITYNFVEWGLAHLGPSLVQGGKGNAADTHDLKQLWWTTQSAVWTHCLYDVNLFRVLFLCLSTSDLWRLFPANIAYFCIVIMWCIYCSVTRCENEL